MQKRVCKQPNTIFSRQSVREFGPNKKNDKRSPMRHGRHATSPSRCSVSCLQKKCAAASPPTQPFTQLTARFCRRPRSPAPLVHAHATHRPCPSLPVSARLCFPISSPLTLRRAPPRRCVLSSSPARQRTPLAPHRPSPSPARHPHHPTPHMPPQRRSQPFRRDP